MNKDKVKSKKRTYYNQNKPKKVRDDNDVLFFVEATRTLRQQEPDFVGRVRECGELVFVDSPTVTWQVNQGRDGSTYVTASKVIF